MKIKACRNSISWVLAIVFIIGLFGNAGLSHASLEPSTKSKHSLVIQHATVVDVRSGKLIQNQTIIVNGNKISYIGNGEDVTLPKNAKVRDATGQYVIPGLWDMHVHLLKDYKHAFPLFLAHGVTGIRDLGTDMSHIELWKKAIQNGMPAPRTVYTGAILNQGVHVPFHFDLKTEQEARKAVRSIAEKGGDFVKVYSGLPRSIYNVVIDEARKYRLPVTGHLPFQVRAIDGVRMGQKSMEHLNGLFIATSSKEAELLKKPDLPKRYFEYEMIANKHYDSKVAAKLFNEFAENEVWQVPTLITPINMAKLEIDPRAKYVPPAIQKEWITFIKTMKDTKELKLNVEYAKMMGGLVEKMNDAGVPIMAGTDSATLIPNSIFGSSLHDELQLLVKNGLSPLQALQTATINPARYFERVYELGTVEEGKLADLVVLEANPLEDIRNTARISAVVFNGKLMEKKELAKAIKTYDLVKMEDVKLEPKQTKPSNSSLHHHGLHAH
ncbi:amidohydrolase family protein [Paenibacillus agilis]|uniref:amidohydrolase family protein n=1 Tax=Paenibacillus agilis TaxID=3020863 RepID=UPI0016497A3F|nr:amidohydrolase family protein [Paenibacillus agilis]